MSDKSYMLLRFPNFRFKALTLSYDDGPKEDKELIRIMSENGLKGTFNLNTFHLERFHDEYLIHAQDAVDLYLKSGNEVAIHGYKHLHLSELDEAMATAEVLMDRQCHEKLFGVPVQGMAYAYCSYNASVMEILKKCGVLYARIGGGTGNFSLPTDWLQWAPTCHHNHPQLMEIADRFLEDADGMLWKTRPRLLYVWGHSNEFRKNNNWDVMEKFAKYMGNREDVWYATNMEIFQYVRAFERLEFGANGDFVYNPSCLDVYMNYYGKQVVVPAGQTASLV